MGGILKQKKYLPTKFCPLQFEFELASTATDVLSIGGAHESTNFVISNVQLKCDLVTLDSQLDNSYAQHLLDGHNIPLHFSTFTTASQLITDINSSVNVQRTFTRLKSVFVSLSSDDTTHGGKEINNFFHPMADETNYKFTKELEFQMSLGAHLFPEYPQRSLCESFLWTS